MLKRLLLCFLFALLLFPLSVGAEERITEKIEVTIAGEIISPVCYLDHNGKGSEHRACAESSVASGLPLALLEDDTEFLYLVVTPDHKPATEEMRPYIAQRVQVQGKLMEGNGLTIIEVENISPVSS
jgi:hypothetical protein